MPCLLGIDSGLTVTKAVIFDEKGNTLAVARRRIPQLIPAPHHIERDMDGLWAATAEAISEAITMSGRKPADIACVATTAHGDGLYLLDRQQKPLGNAILSLDSRAGPILAEWDANGMSEKALSLSGQAAHAAAPSVLLNWMQRHQPERYSAIGHVMACKDWLRFCLTGSIGTDLTEASTSFTNVRTQVYDLGILELFGLEALRHALPPVARPDEVIGHVSSPAAVLTGLAEGTPVVAGLHDVTASALGIGGYGTGIVALIAGTFSINETVSEAPRIGCEWLCRNGLKRGEWNHMAISPASSANYDWFLDTLCRTEREAAGTGNHSIHARITPEIEAALNRPSSLLFHPYLYGSPHGPAASGGFVGLRGWHDRGDMLRAVVEGIAFNHRVHVDALRREFDFSTARLTGGISRNPVFAQVFADVLGMPVTVTDTDEAAAWGTALCAGSGVGIFASPRHDPRDLEAIGHTYTPDASRTGMLQQRYDLHCDIAMHMSSFWPRLEAMDSGEPAEAAS